MLWHRPIAQARSPDNKATKIQQDLRGTFHIMLDKYLAWSCFADLNVQTVLFNCA